MSDAEKLAKWMVNTSHGLRWPKYSKQARLAVVFVAQRLLDDPPAVLRKAIRKLA